MPLPQEIADSGNNFSPSFSITDELGQTEPWSQWEGSFDATSGVSGLWFPTEDWMVVTNRGLAHHNQQYRAVEDREGPLSPVMPWAADRTGGGWHLDLPSSAGGMTQVMTRLDLTDDVDTWQHGYQVGPEVLWPVAYTSRRLDLPPSTQVRFLYRPDSMPSVEDTYHKTAEFPLEEAYTELRFTPAGDPEPAIGRRVHL